MPSSALTSLLAASALQLAADKPIGSWLEEAIPTGVDEPIEVVGACPKHRLVRGVQLQPAPELYTIWFPDRVWGRQEAIEVITRVAEEMAWVMPEADPIIVGDISTQFGGELKGHISHRSGVDLDISVYWKGASTYLGDNPRASPYHLDLEANWLLIRSLIETGMVERILLDQRNIDRIKRFAIESGDLTPREANRIFPEPESRDRYLTGVVHHAPQHQEHMHVRVLCWSGI